MILVGTCLKNEVGRVLKQWLDHASQWADGIVVLDDGSTDGSADLCREYDKVLEVHTQHLPRSEGRDRQTLWDLMMEHSPEWCVLLDADEIFEEDVSIPFLLSTVQSDFSGSLSFPMCHFWKSKTHYRIDGVWHPDRVLEEGRIVRGCKGLVYPSHVTEHVSNVPYRRVAAGYEYESLPIMRVPGIRIRHYSFIFDDDVHRAKYQERMQRNSDAYSWAHHIDPDANYEDGMQLLEWPDWWRDPYTLP